MAQIDIQNVCDLKMICHKNDVPPSIGIFDVMSFKAFVNSSVPGTNLFVC